MKFGRILRSRARVWFAARLIRFGRRCHNAGQAIIASEERRWGLAAPGSTWRAPNLGHR